MTAAATNLSNLKKLNQHQQQQENGKSNGKDFEFIAADECHEKTSSNPKNVNMTAGVADLRELDDNPQAQ